jgi:8-oxo-dGTP diphosphatase
LNLRGVEFRVVRGNAPAAPCGASDLETGGGAVDASGEQAVRRACAGLLAEALGKRRPYVALPALGVGEGGLTPVAVGKIMVQEAIRVARGGQSGLREIRFSYPFPEGFEEFERAVAGYVRHFLETLIWGPFVTVDAIIEAGVGNAPSAPGRNAPSAPGGVVLIERSNPPFGFALPGGFVDYGESLEQAVRREAREETGLELLDLRQFHTYSDPSRDPRFHTVTTVFSARAEGLPTAGDDAAAVRVVRIEEIGGLSFAFDHGQVVKDYLSSRRRP